MTSGAMHLVASCTAAILAAVLIHALRTYRRPELSGFAFGFLALSAVELSLLLDRSFLLSRPSTDAYRFLLALATFVATAVHLHYFLLAAGDATGLAISATTRRRRLQAAGGAGALVSLLLVGIDQTPARDALHAALPLVVSAFAFGGVVVVTLRDRRLAPPRLVLLALFAAAALGQGARAALAAKAPFGNLVAAAPVTSVVLQAGCCLAILLIVLESEWRSASATASHVEHLAYRDNVTSLPNRILLLDRLNLALAHASRHKHKLAVLFIDIDRFKLINDSLGHDVGDSILKTTAERIQTCIRGEDTIARFGGDELVVLIHILGRLEDAGKVAEKIGRAIAMPVIVGSHEIVVTGSIGISVYPLDGNDAETLLKHADTAMYRAKEEGGNRSHYYSPAMNARALETLEMEVALRQAVTREELVLHYQPLIDVGSGTIVGLEALLRWNHPRLGLLPPDRFLPVAEASGLIIPIGGWVLGEACRQAKRWQRRRCELFVSVNLSARQCQHASIVDTVREALEAAQLPPHLLELEITETHAMANVEASLEMLGQLKSLGVRIAIDDFGTGYSSLSYLKQFPVDTLKLDQSFVRDITIPQDGTIARGIIAMAHSMNLTVVAEGVETIGQLDFLRSESCDRLQGFLFSRPLPAAVFDKYLSHHGPVMRVA